MALQKEKTPVKSQDPELRIKNFDEVCLGYNKSEAVQEAGRCLQCKDPACVKGCPVEVPIPDFIKAIIDDDLDRAAHIIKSKNNLPAICGRVCPQEEQCEKLCIMGKKYEPVAIGRLERFVGDYALKKAGVSDSRPAKIMKKKEKIAVVGSGPAGLTAAADLAKEGYQVTLFEALHAAGGVLRYGIPEFRLPENILDQEVSEIQKLGVEIKLNVVIGKTITIDELFAEGYSTVFIGTGAGLPKFLGLPGENLNGIYSANEFLTRVNLMKAYKFPEYKTPVRIGKKVAVIGGGNVAMDSARTAVRLGAEEVSIIYRRSKEELPARDEEIEHAEEEGVIFRLSNNPTAFHGENGRVKSIECVKMKLEGIDSSGRPVPVPVAGSNWSLEVDNVIIAIGQTPNPLLKYNTPGLKTNLNGGIIVDENLSASIPGVYAGGDIVTGAATVIKAMGAGKKAAQSIIKYLEEK
ncbi:MAG: NADPH-dependent glutamate synthase [Halanaerobiaceae bacterium]|nr:NADPH-dependent glutamate synthase [Halanaerobiaceae bacterium]